jgi:hypothetical protein
MAAGAACFENFLAGFEVLSAGELCVDRAAQNARGSANIHRADDFGPEEFEDIKRNALRQELVGTLIACVLPVF